MMGVMGLRETGGEGAEITPLRRPSLEVNSSFNFSFDLTGALSGWFERLDCGERRGMEVGMVRVFS